MFHKVKVKFLKSKMLISFPQHKNPFIKTKIFGNDNSKSTLWICNQKTYTDKWIVWYFKLLLKGLYQHKAVYILLCIYNGPYMVTSITYMMYEWIIIYDDELRSVITGHLTGKWTSRTKLHHRWQEPLQSNVPQQTVATYMTYFKSVLH